jgi:predicted nucleotidyltransferase
MVTRNDILSYLEEGLKEHPKIFAMWLEGSDGTGSADKYSDIDLVLDVEDGFESETLSLCGELLKKLSPVDLSYEEPIQNPQMRYKVFHLKNTPEQLFLDISVQSHSRKIHFVKQNDSEVPKVIFDKKKVIKYKNINEVELKEELIERLYHLENTINQKARAEKYVKRNKFIEAVGYYQKFVITPLIELLRIKYKPINYNYYIVCISKHLPRDVTLQLEELYKINSINDISVYIEQAYNWFYEVLNEVKAELEEA